MVFALLTIAAWLICMGLFTALTSMRLPRHHPRHRATGRPTVAEIERRITRERRARPGAVAG